MARNVEIKALVADAAALRVKVAGLADRGAVEVDQDDTFFNCASGRLKLRAFPDGTGQLIYYQRANQQGPKESFYELSPTHAPDALRATLTLAYGQAGRVRKHRTLFEIGKTRVHLDEVEGLGHFLELEVVLADGESANKAVLAAHQWMKRFEINPDQLIEGSYVELLSHSISKSSVQFGAPISRMI